MDGPLFLPESLTQKSLSVTSDRELFQILKENPLDLIDYLEVACADEPWADNHLIFIRSTLRWLSKKYYLSQLPFYLAQRLTKIIQNHYVYLEPLLCFRPALFFTFVFYVEKKPVLVNSLLFGVLSSYFHYLIKSKGYEQMRDEWELSRVTISQFELIHTHISRGQIEDLWKYSQVEIVALMQLAKRWELPLLAKECASILRRYINHDNVVNTLLQAHRESFVDWKNECRMIFNQQNWGLRCLEGRESDFRIEILDYKQNTLELFDKLALSITHLTFGKNLSESSYYDKLINQCPKLIGIDLSGSSQYAQQFDDLPIHLNEVDLSLCLWLKPDHLKELARLLPYLKHLALMGNTHLNYSYWSQLNRFDQLIHLDLAGCSQLTDEDLHLISHSAPKLLELNLEGCRTLTDKGIIDLVHYSTHLNILSLNDTNISDKTLNELGTYAYSLTRLSVKSCSFLSDKGLWQMLHLRRNLQFLDIRNCEFSLQIIEHIRQRFPFLKLID